MDRSSYTFQDIWLHGYSKVLLLKYFSKSKAGFMPRASKFRWLIFSWLPLFSLIFIKLHAPDSSRAITLVIIDSASMMGAIAAAFLAWGYVAKRAKEISSLLGDSAGTVCKVVNIAFSQILQTLMLIVSFTFGAVVETHLHVATFQSYLTKLFLTIFTGISVAVIMSAIYWLLVTPSIAYRLKLPNLNLRWNDPARTPGIRSLAEGYLTTSFFLALAAVAAWIPPVVHHPLVSSTLVKYFLLSIFILNLWVSVGPQMSIFLIVRRKKLLELDLLDQLYPDPGGIEGRRKDLEKYEVYTSSYSSITAAPHLPYGTSVIVQFVVLTITITSSYLPKIGH